MSPTTSQEESGFVGLGIAPKLLEILAHHKYVTPTPIQKAAIPVAVEGKDVMGIAQTGTGKTLSFGIPMLQRLAAVKGKGLVILPTRELALQVDETFVKVGKGLGLRTAVLIGGASMHRQMSMLRANPHVIIATPGRLIDHLNQKTVHLNDVSVLVLDEADRMLDMGFEPQIKRILQSVPKERQTMLFSATMPQEIVRIATSYMKLPVRIEIARAGTTADTVTQELFVVKKDDKNRLLEKLLGEHRGAVLVFSRTKFGAKKILRAVKTMGHTGAEIHSNRSLAQRREALDGFKSGRYRVLVATDIAARGIDVTGIAAVINYDVPENPDDYVHRIGRTGRAGMKGHAITFAQPDQGDEVRSIERVTRMHLPITKLPADLPPHRAMAPVERDEARGGFGRHGGSSRGGHGGSKGGFRQNRSNVLGGSRPKFSGTIHLASKPAAAHGAAPSHGGSASHASKPAASHGTGHAAKPAHGGHAKPSHGGAHKPSHSGSFRATQDSVDSFLGSAGKDGGVGFFGPHSSGDIKRKPAKIRRDFNKRGGKR